MKLKSFLGSLLMAATAMGTAWANNYPAKPINLIVPYPAGGPSDFFARKVQPDAANRLGQPMVIENIGGAGGAIGLSKLVNAPADGYTVSLGSPMELVLTPMAIQGVKYKSEDFRLVAQFATTNTILAVRNSLNVKTVDELLALARRSADKPLSYGSVGPGSLYHLIGEKFSQLTKVETLHVPYKGIAPLLTDLMGGQIDMAFLPMAGSIPQALTDGKIQGLAVTAKTPHPLFRQFPAMAAMRGPGGDGIRHLGRHPGAQEHARERGQCDQQGFLCRSRTAGHPQSPGRQWQCGPALADTGRTGTHLPGGNRALSRHCQID